MDHFNDHFRVFLHLFWNMKDNFTFVVFVWKRATRAFFEIFPSMFYGRKKIKQVWNEGKWWQNFHYGVNTLIKSVFRAFLPLLKALRDCSAAGLRFCWPEAEWRTGLQLFTGWRWVEDRWTIARGDEKRGDGGRGGVTRVKKSLEGTKRPDAEGDVEEVQGNPLRAVSGLMTFFSPSRSSSYFDSRECIDWHCLMHISQLDFRKHILCTCKLWHYVTKYTLISTIIWAIRQDLFFF